MAIIRGYFDDSGEEIDPQHKACSLFGYIADGNSWPGFETKWQKALDDAGMPYFHMKEFAHFLGHSSDTAQTKRGVGHSSWLLWRQSSGLGYSR